MKKFAAGVLTGVVACYVGMYAAVWHHLTRGAK